MADSIKITEKNLNKKQYLIWFWITIKMQIINIPFTALSKAQTW